MDTRARNGVQRRIISRMNSGQATTAPSFKRSRRASVAMLALTLPKNIKRIASKLLPKTDSGHLTDKDNQTKDADWPVLSDVPTSKDFEIEIRSQQDKSVEETSSQPRSKSLLKHGSRSGTRLCLLEHEFPLTTVQSRSSTDPFDTDRRSDTHTSCDEKIDLLTDISSTIQKIVLWSHPT